MRRLLAAALCLVAACGVESRAPSGSNCDPSYPDACIAPPPPKLNCDDVREKNFKVRGADPHGFDRDKDGVGCEEK